MISKDRQNDDRPIRILLRDDVGVIELARPAVFNCLSRQMLVPVCEAVERFERERAKVVLIVANGKNFCTGTALDEVMEVANAMRSIPVSDMFTKNATLRPDGRLIHDMLLVEVKSPEESKYAWGYCRIKGVLPGPEAFRPMTEGGCSLART